MSANRLDRRRFLWSAGGGLGGIALAQLLGRRACWPAKVGLTGLVPSGTAGCIIRRGRGGSSSSSCRARPASATRSTTSRC